MRQSPQDPDVNRSSQTNITVKLLTEDPATAKIQRQMNPVVPAVKECSDSNLMINWKNSPVVHNQGMPVVGVCRYIPGDWNSAGWIIPHSGKKGVYKPVHHPSLPSCCQLENSLPSRVGKSDTAWHR